MADFFIGIDLGGTNTKIGCFDSQFTLIAKTSIPTEPEQYPERVVDRIAAAAQQLLESSDMSMDCVRAVGVGAPGPLDVQRGTIIAAPNLPLFNNIPLRQMVGRRLGKPTVLDNDANTACWGEHVVGVARGVDEMVFFTLGTGIGGGIISSGELVHGAGNAAELGHIIIYPEGRLCNCGQRGCAESYASADSTVRRAAEAIEAGATSTLADLLKKNEQITCRDIYEKSTLGDELAVEITEGTAKTLGLLCVNVFHVTEPARIVFAGGMIAAGEPLLERIRHYFAEYIWLLKEESVEICFATLGQDAGIIGAAALAQHEFCAKRSNSI